ncbi:hypothetical protein, partial [Mycolicibacterium iranicum]
GPTLPLLGQLGPSGLAVLGQNGQAPAGSFGIPAVAGLDPNTVLAQNAVPSAPGAGPGTPPNLNIFNNAYGIPQYLEPSAPGEGVIFDVAPGQENADVSKREWFGRWIDMYRAGQLEGGLFGQRPQAQLGQPLPGTAPPPGVNLPPGPAQFYVPPGTVPAEGTVPVPPPPPPG